MRHFCRLAVCATVLVAYSRAQAIIVFSDVVINGSLSTGATFTTGPNDIDFFLPDAYVGDVIAPRRSGDIAITYRASSDNFMVADELTLAALGAISGNGTIFFTEVVEDIVSGDILATASAMLTSQSDLPYTETLHFLYASRDVKVKKSFILTAIDSNTNDFAAVNLVEQNFHLVPEPATIAAVGIGVVALLRRRR